MATKLHALKTKTWFGFDLDDTIHNPRSASSAASLAVFGGIYEGRDIPVKTALAAALTPKPGALELFKQLKARGKNTVVVTEGPRDAQKWTVEQLGLAPCVDVLVASNEVGLAKDAGLFGEVLERCGIRKEDMVSVGDRLEGDVVPAKAVGVLGVLFDERDEYRDVRVGEGNGEDVLRVNSLTEIGDWRLEIGCKIVIRMGSPKPFTASRYSLP